MILSIFLTITIIITVDLNMIMITTIVFMFVHSAVMCHDRLVCLSLRFVYDRGIEIILLILNA